MKAPKQLPVPLLIGMEDSAKNNADALFFTQLFVPQASQSSSYRRREIAFAIFSSRPRRQAPAEWRKYEKSY